jgi:hypothetical protein
MNRQAGALVLAVAVALAMGASVPGAWAQHLGKSLPEREIQPDEHLAMPKFPSGWQRYLAQSGTIEVFDYLPKGQTAATWRDKITLEVHHDTNTLPLDAYQRRALGQVRENCDGILEGRLQTGVNNGFPAAYWMLGCKRSKHGDYGEIRYTKAIQGGNTLYLLSRAWRTPVYDDAGPQIDSSELQSVKDFLGSSVVCASEGQHPCPAGDNPGPQ